ncbi:mannose-1-phosphate guanylyltransferase/mannose-6-phosphate isomerase [Acetobacter sp. AN02]|uniref:mannose-1-phosphate guanylyltransferase/mannose-6-phosphate isomerase n=1 Tax=Acetobacter sp. AN02 TaxID=2894186 RepID=UPI0038CF40E1
MSDRHDDSESVIIPVILSGGSGSRLWPMSRASYPKQLWPLLGDLSLLQETALRARSITEIPPVFVCNEEHRFLIAEQLRQADITGARLVLEPEGRNSAPAITAAALLVAEKNPGAVLWLMAADAAISRPEALKEAVSSARAGAERGLIMTFGMHPTRPETGYGYIEAGEDIADLKGVVSVRAFREKPDRATAEAFLSEGNYFWNSGMFMFRADVLLKEMQKHAPEVVASVQQAVSNRTHDMFFERLGQDEFRQAPDISIDYALAEKTENIAVVPADLGWSDVGSWTSLWEISEKDQAGNVSIGDVIVENTQNCYVRSDNILTVVNGLDDAIVVVTGDAVLVTHHDKAQDIRSTVEQLKKNQRPQAVSHNRRHRPWGYYESLIRDDRFQVKRIVVSPGEKLSLQKHFHRAEHWVVVGGTALVTRDGETLMIRENESIYLPLGSLHRLENPGKIPLTLIEVQTGSYLGEDDIVRLEDIYNRD